MNISPPRRPRLPPLFFVLALCMGAPHQALSQEPAPPAVTQTAAPEEEEEEDRVYRIRKVDFNITGPTRPFALIIYGEFREGEIITGKADLERYIDHKRQLLLNQRVLESVGIEYTTAEAGEDGLVPVDLLVSTVDTWNIIVLPYPKFDTNTGFELIFKARDYNFLGTMNPLRIDLGYKMDPEYVYDGFFSNLTKGALVFELDSNTPFRAFGYTWNLNFDHAISYTYQEPLYYRNNTGLSLDFPYKSTTFTFGFEESFILHEENEARYQGEYGKYFDDLWYMSSELYTAWKIPTGLTVGGFGDLNYTPKLSGNINYRPGGDIGYLRRGPTLTFSHNLGFGQINWVGNYRSGLEASLSNAYGYNFYKAAWNKDIALTSVGHFPITPFFGISGRVQYKHWFDDYYDEAGDVLRGLLNKALAADALLSLNLDFPFLLFRFLPSRWFNYSPFRFFEFEFHLSPFVDIALAHDPLRNIQFSPRDILVTGGLEAIVFPSVMRSIYLRISLGYNLREFFKTGKLPEGDNRELFIGLGHHY